MLSLVFEIVLIFGEAGYHLTHIKEYLELNTFYMQEADTYAIEQMHL